MSIVGLDVHTLLRCEIHIYLVAAVGDVVICPQRLSLGRYRDYWHEARDRCNCRDVAVLRNIRILVLSLLLNLNRIGR